MNIAAKVAAAKAKHPEDFCPVKGCLWRVYTSRGVNPCRKHSSGASEAKDTVSCGGSHSDVASEPDEGKARSTVRFALERETYLRNADHRSCQCPKCRPAF